MIAFIVRVFIQKEIGRKHFSIKIIEKIIKSALIPFFFNSRFTFFSTSLVTKLCLLW